MSYGHHHPPTASDTDAWGGSITIRNVGGSPCIVDDSSIKANSKIVGREVSNTTEIGRHRSWIPVGPSEIGLIEAIDRRGGNSAATFLSLSTRPTPELECNFYDYRGCHVNLNSPQYLFSHTDRALASLEDTVEDCATLAVNDVLKGLQQKTTHFAVDHYYLVSYQDYSTYATYTYFNQSQREGWFTPGYVVRHFAVRIGPNQGGVFIPITEAQFLLGGEIIATDVLCGRRDPTVSYLKKDDFTAIATAPTSKSTTHTAAVASGMRGEVGYHVPTSQSLSRTVQCWWNRWLVFRNKNYVVIGRMVWKSLVVASILYLGFRIFQAPQTPPMSTRGRQNSKISVDESSFFPLSSFFVSRN